MRLIVDTLSYKNRLVLEKIRQDVDYGDFINIIGQNGSGKSSLFKAFLGDLCYKGMIEFLPSEIAVVSDYARVPKELKVSDVIGFVKNNSENNVDNLIALLGLDKTSNHKVGKLSSGEKRRVEIFVALSSKKKIVIYDEITNALDAGTKKELLDFIKIYHSQNDKIAFYTAHDLAEMFYLGGKYWYVNPSTKSIEDISGESEDEIIKKYVFGGV